MNIIRKIKKARKAARMANFFGLPFSVEIKAFFRTLLFKKD